MVSRVFKRRLLGVVGVLVVAAVAAPLAVSAQDDASRKMMGAPKIGEASAAYRSLQGKAARSEAEINRNAQLRDRMIVAARSRDVGAARKVLLETGFTPEDLEGVPIKLQPGGGGAGGAAKFKIVKIELKCCPPELIITIEF